MGRRLLTLVLGALFGALLHISQVVLAGLPNIELVSLLIIVWTRVFRWWALPGIAVFILLQGLMYGFGIYWMSYLYIWFLLWGIVILIPRRPAPPLLRAVGWALLSGAYGFAFGALTAIPWFFIGGPSAALSYWLAGLPFDALHAGGNFVFALILAVPLMDVLEKIGRRAHMLDP
ncbi:MAG: hypothetical protein E7654_08210 [Ruminococcaceae bacterium]|nr:hypothetical protein [Oscillospiraceae bacterium]